MKTIFVSVQRESDVAVAARFSRQLAADLGFSVPETHCIATAASELAANLWVHAGGGMLEIVNLAPLLGLELIATDQGPGIVDIGQAMQEGFSTAGGLGCGLPGVQRLMDELTIDSQPGEGTVVRARKWRNAPW